MVFEGNYRNAWTYLSFQFQMKKKERYVNSKWTCWSSNLSYFRSENGCGKWYLLVWKGVMIWGNRRHIPTKNSQERTPYWGKYWYFFICYWQQLTIIKFRFLNFVLYEEYYYKDRGEAEADNTFRDLHNSSDNTKAKFNNWFIIHSK